MKTRDRKKSVSVCGAGRRATTIECLEPRRLLTSLVVNSLSDTLVSNPPTQVTLRGAVAAADISTSPTTITFDPNVFSSKKTILLTDGQLHLTNTGQPVTITGPAAGVVISGNDQVNLLIDAKVNAALTNLTFTQHAGVAAPGDSNSTAIVNKGVLTLTSSTITGNNDWPNPFPVVPDCAGLLNYGSATLTGVVISNNSTAGGGGGITNYSSGVLKMTGSTVSGNSNSASIYGAGGGGGIYNAGDATLSNVTISGNVVEGGKGGGIYCGNGSLDLINSTISGNTATDEGGGIYSKASATILDCSITKNIALAGGGIANQGPLKISNSTISGNTSNQPGGSQYGYGGAIQNLVSGSAVISGATVSGNSAAKSGGGIYNQGKLTLTDSTLSGNSGPAGGGIVNDYDTSVVSIFDSTIVSNTGGAIFERHKVSVANSIVTGTLQGKFASSGHNFVGQTDNSSGWTSSDLKGTAAHPLDPKLGALINNGGFTQTMLPLLASPVVDAGADALIPSGLATDQRGLARIHGGAVDIGAVEVQTSTFTGTVFDDANKNGKQDAGEAALARWEVYDDANDNGKLDAGESAVFSNATGGYTLAVGGSGTAYIRQIIPASWTQTLPAGNGAYHSNLSFPLSMGLNFGDYTSIKYLSTVASTSGLVAWWTFDSSAQANSIINGYTGTLKGGAKISTAASAPIAGEKSSGLSLNGTSAYVDTNLTTQQEFITVHPITVNGHPSSYTTAAATFNVWVNFGSTPITSGHIYSILAKSQFGNDLDLQLETDGKIHFYTDNGSSASFAPSSLTGWHMLTAEFDTAAKTRQIFWDGKLAISANPYTGSHATSTGAFSIGDSDVFTGRYYNGSIDEVSLWNRALTAAEILAIFNASK